MSRPQKVLTAKRPDREIFDHQILDRQIPDRTLSPTGGVNPTRVSPLSWDRRLSCYRTSLRGTSVASRTFIHTIIGVSSSTISIALSLCPQAISSNGT